MDIDVVDPELRPALAKLPRLDPSKRSMRFLGRVGPRLMSVPKREDVTTTVVRDGRFRARVHRPSVPGGMGMLWIHGGGLVIGAAKQDERLCVQTASELGMIVVAIEYRLAPEAPFPAALDDASAGWQWMLEHADDLGIDPSEIVVGGESAGGSIAASLVHLLHDQAGTQPAAQWLFSPMLDDRTAARRELDAPDHWVWNNRANHFGWKAYLGVEPGAAEMPPYAVPARRADLTGMPPTWMCTGDIELFQDEITVYADRLRQAGVSVELDVVTGAPHGFENWAATTAPAQGMIARGHDWLRGILGLN